MDTIKKIFLSIITPTESNGQMLYYGLILYILANIFVEDLIAIILVACIIGVIIGYKGWVKKSSIGLMDFIFGIAPSLLIYFELIF